MAGRAIPVRILTGLPIALLRDPAGAPVKVTVGLPGGPALRPDLGRPGGPDPAAAARLLHRGERAAARGHRPAVRRRQRPPAGPGTAARRGRGPRGPRVLRDDGHPNPRCSTPTRVMPASSAWSGSASTSIRSSASTRRSRAAGRARSSRRTRRCRPESTGSTRPDRAHFADDPLLPIDQVLALGAETYEGGDRTCSTWP